MPKAPDPNYGYVKGLDRDGVLRDLAARYGLDGDALVAYANEDTHIGWQGASELLGSVWTHEAQILYALVRHERPHLVYEFGTGHAISTLHLAAALEANGVGNLITVDVVPKEKVIAERLDALAARVTFVQETAYTYEPMKCDFVFEDANHFADLVEHIARNARRVLKSGGFCVHHDSVQHIVGPALVEGMKAAGVDYTSYEVLPYDGNVDTRYGLAFWRQA